MTFVTKKNLALFSSIGLLMMSQNVQADTCTKPKVKGYEYVGCLHEGLAGVVTKDNKVGFVNQSGKLVIPSIYDAESMGEGGEVSGTHDFSEGLVSVHKSINGSDGGMQGSYGYIDTTGKVVIPFTLGYTAKFSNGLAIVQNENGMGAIDKTGKTIIPFQYTDIGEFVDGIAPASKNEKYGFIDKNNRAVTPFIYDGAKSFKEGLAGVQKNNRWGYIDKTGKVIIPISLPYEHVGQFSEGLAPVYAYASTNDDNMKFGYIDRSGKLVIPLKFSKPYEDKIENEEHWFKNGKAKVMDFKGQTFCINKQGAKITCK